MLKSAYSRDTGSSWRASRYDLTHAEYLKLMTECSTLAHTMPLGSSLRELYFANAYRFMRCAMQTAPES